MTNNFTRAFAYLFLGGLSHSVKARLEHALGNHYFNSEKATTYHMFTRIPLYTVLGLLFALQMELPVTGAFFFGGFVGCLVLGEALIRLLVQDKTNKHPGSLVGKVISLPLELLLR